MSRYGIVIKPNPLSSGTPVAADLAAMTGVDQGTVAAKLDAEIRAEQDRRLMDPAAYSNVNDPYDVVKTAAETVKVELLNPEMAISAKKGASDKQGDGAAAFSVDEMNDWNTAAEWANSLYPNDEDITGASIASDEQIDAGAVNGDSDMTNQSLDFMNSIEPTPVQPDTEIDVVPDGVDEGEDEDDDPSEVAGDSI